MAKREKKPFYVKVCPKCKSVNVEISHQGRLSGLVALGVPTVYRCRDCGFSASAFPEINLNEKKIKIKGKGTIKVIKKEISKW